MTATTVDIIGLKGATGRPDEIRGLSQRFADVGEAAARVRTGLAGLGAERWTGEAAEAFRADQDRELPKQLGTITNAFGSASRALGTYGRQLDDVQQRAEQLANELDGARDQAERARIAAAAANNDERAAARRRDEATWSCDPVAERQAATNYAAARARTAAAHRAREAAQARVSAVEARGAALREELHAHGKRCSASLKSAAESSLSEDFFHKIKQALADSPIGEAVEGLVLGAAELVDRALDGTNDLMTKLLTGDIDGVLEAISRTLDDVANVLAVVGMIVLVATVVVLAAVAIGVTGGAAALPILGAIGTVSGVLGVGVLAGKFGVESGLYYRGDRTPDEYDKTVRDTAIDAATSKLKPLKGVSKNHGLKHQLKEHPGDPHKIRSGAMVDAAEKETNAAIGEAKDYAKGEAEQQAQALHRQAADPAAVDDASPATRKIPGTDSTGCRLRVPPAPFSLPILMQPNPALAGW